MPYGYNGKILHVDLTKGTWEIEEPDPAFYRTYLGGSSLASYYLLKELKPGLDPLSPDNVLVVAGSVLTGAPLSGFSRYTVAAKSPLTGAFGEAEAGGYFGPELKFAGFDAVVIKGRAPQPVYLWIRDGQVEIRDAKNVWGLENGPALDRMREEVGEVKARAATIGPAGERLTLIANVMNETAHANGRSGLGAVFGSKNLKGILVRGDSGNLKFADEDKVKELTKWLSQRIREHGPNINMSKLGTPMFVKGLNSGGILPTRNWTTGVFEGADKINADALAATVLKRAGTCFRCAVACKRVVAHTATAENPWDVDPRYGGPEYETLAAFGSICGVDNLVAVSKANELCNRFGLDTIAAGGAIAFAMECFEKGILTEKDADGRKVLFGDAAGMLWLLEEIIHRRGLGDILAQGVKRAAERIGRGAQEYAFTIKGQEIPFHDPRGKTGVGLGFAVSPTGADHVESPHESAFVGQAVTLVSPLGLYHPAKPLALDEEKVKVFKNLQLTWAMNNVIGVCNFTVAPNFALTYDKLMEAAQAITGWNLSFHEFMRAAERSIVMARLFNLREGFGPEDDRLFRRLHEPMPEGPLKGQYIDREALAKAIRFYYEMVGWDQSGRPSRAKLVDLDLAWADQAA